MLSPLLFNLVLANVAQYVTLGVKWLMFADDLILYVRIKDARVECSKLQRILNVLISWLMNLGLRVSSSKSQLSVFYIW